MNYDPLDFQMNSLSNVVVLEPPRQELFKLEPPRQDLFKLEPPRQELFKLEPPRQDLFKLEPHTNNRRVTYKAYSLIDESNNRLLKKVNPPNPLFTSPEEPIKLNTTQSPELGKMQNILKSNKRTQKIYSMTQNMVPNKIVPNSSLNNSLLKSSSVTKIPTLINNQIKPSSLEAFSNKSSNKINTNVDINELNQIRDLLLSMG
jgi:hypothetical protein